jgi:hypothetical protein
LVSSESELDLLVGGLENIDIEDLRANSLYEGFLSSSQQIVWFWDILRSLSIEQRRHFLKVTTRCRKSYTNADEE